MNDFQYLIIEPLKSIHNRAGFHCGVESLDRYLSKQAGQDIKRSISRVFVATQREEPEKVIGFYSPNALSIELNQLPEKLVRKLPKHPIPAALIGKLAVCNAAQGKGIGKMLLADAIKRTLSVGEQIAIYAIVVDAINEKAKSFYERYGFTRLSDNSSRLFLPMKSITQ